MKRGIANRILVAGSVMVALIGLSSGLFVATIADLRGAANDQRRADQSVLAASRLQRIALDLQTGERGYAISGDERFLRPWTDAQRSLPAAEAALRSLVAGSAAAPLAAGAIADVNAYLAEWSRPVVALARTDPAAARRRVASGGGERRIGAIRTAVARISATQDALAAARHRTFADDERLGIAIGLAGVGVMLLLLGARLRFFMRTAIWPLRRLAAATERIAAGDLDARAAAGGTGEIGRLAESFNTMADSLQRSRDELERALEVNRAVLDSTVDGICLTDREGEILLVNRPMVEFVVELGLPQEGTVPERLLAVADRFTDPEGYRAAMRRIAAAPDEPSFDEFEFTDTRRCFQGFTAPVLDPAGTVVGRVWTLREVTREREADRAKDEFVATVSHELRTPLTSIVGFLEMLLDEDAGTLTDEQREYLEIVQRSSQRLMRQVGDLLFMARLEEAGLTLAKGPVSLADVASECAAANEALARTRGIELVVGAADVPVLSGDRERLAQVAANLLSNAIKFTPEGGRVDVRTFVADGSAVLEVEDTGIGIPEDERGRLFERFFRSSAATRAAVQGTGLGLAISKAIVDAHDGTISAEPGGAGGSLFRVELPL